WQVGWGTVSATLLGAKGSEPIRTIRVAGLRSVLRIIQSRRPEHARRPPGIRHLQAGLATIECWCLRTPRRIFLFRARSVSDGDLRVVGGKQEVCYKELQ